MKYTEFLEKQLRRLNLKLSFSHDIKYTPSRDYQNLPSFKEVAGAMPFTSPLEKRFWQARQDYCAANNIDFNYMHIEENFYERNSLGYRTPQELDDLSGLFDLVLGCSHTEGIGLRSNEIWHSHHYPKVVNLGKSGCSPSFILDTVLTLISRGQAPENCIIQWPMPFRYTPIFNDVPYPLLPMIPENWFKEMNGSVILAQIVQEIYQKTLEHNEIWSNQFLQIYTTVNALLKDRKHRHGKVTNFIIANGHGFENGENFNEPIFDSLPKDCHLIGVGCLDRAADGLHFGPNTHKAIYQELKQYL